MLLRRWRRAALLAALLVSTVALSPQRSAPAQPAGWSLLLQVDRPYYVGGDTLRARVSLGNDTHWPAFGWAPVRGGNGCEYTLRVLDRSGQVVWEPGRLVNGVFQGPGCAFGNLGVSVLAGAPHVEQDELDLVYQNRAGLGVPGDPLPAGYYCLEAVVSFAGPYRFQPGPPGGAFHATLPFLIER